MTANQMETSTEPRNPKQRLPTIAWCVVTPSTIVTAYLLTGVLMVSLIGDAILGTVLVGGLVFATVIVVRTRWPHWLAFAPAPRPKQNTPRFGWIVVGCAALAFLAGQSLALLLYSIAGSTGYDQSTQMRQDASVAVVVLLGLVAAPVAEEALFRGLLYPMLRKRAGVVASVITSAAVFALIHGNVVQLASSLPLAVLLALVYERTRTLWPCVLIHLGFNLAAMLVPPEVLVPLAHPVPVLLLVAVFFGCALLVYQQVVQTRWSAMDIS